MASCQTKQWADGANYVKLTVTQSSETATTATLSYTLQYITSYPPNTNYAKNYTVTINGSTVKSGSYDINGKNGTYTICSGTVTINKTQSAKDISFGVSFSFQMTWSGTYAGTLSASGSIKISAITSYSVKYNSNGGSGAPGDQTKWHGTNITLSSTKPTRTGYTFQGWGTSSSDTSVDYAAGATYSSNDSITLYAIWKALTYTIKYNANGGSGAPGDQTKTYGVNLTLSSTKPTRTNYTFKGWGTSASATTVSYNAGSTYSSNASITLYAIWTLSYKKPRISNETVIRCDSSGNQSDIGTYAKVIFSWATDKTISSITISWVSGTKTVSASGTSGTVTQICGGSFDTSTSYVFTITVSDASGNQSRTVIMNGQVLPFDIMPGGRGTCFGGVATKNNWDEFKRPVVSTNDSGVQFLIYNAKTGINTSYKAVRSDSGTTCWFGIGEGGINHGIYSDTTGNWVIHSNGNSTYINSTSSGVIYMQRPVRFNGSIRLAQEYTTSVSLGCMWADDAAHDLISNASDGLTSYVGPGSISGINTVTCLRGNTVRLYSHGSGGVYLGSSGSTAITSDKNLKKDILDLDDKYADFFSRLRPVTYKYDSEEYVGHRDHVGFIAQEVEEALMGSGLTTEQFAGICIEEDVTLNPNYDSELDEEENKINDIHYDKLYSLRYEEFIALNTRMIQKQQEIIREQQAKINDLEARLEKLESIINNQEV